MRNYWIGPVVLAGAAFAQEPKVVTQENGAVSVQWKGALAGQVTGSPYSAVAVTENVQTLADGNRIVQNHSEKLYRDGQGRERSEQALKSGFTAVISDPVAKTGYTLNSEARTARQNPGVSFFNIRTQHADAVNSAAQTKLADALLATERNLKLLESSGGGRGAAPSKADANVVTEDLPPQNVEGVYATGKRVTRTIPAGQIGNEKPIVTVEEVWYSPDLRMNVMTKRSDPRSGENTYRLTNISRAEPDPNLFQVPADYTVTPAKK